MVVSQRDEQDNSPLSNTVTTTATTTGAPVKHTSVIKQRDMTSDEEKDVDVESDEEDNPLQQHNFSTIEEKRAHHNALERKRRDHIKDSFSGLRDSIPSLEGEKSSRAQILHKATEHIQVITRCFHLLVCMVR